MLSRRSLAVALAFSLIASGLAQTGFAQDEKKLRIKKQAVETKKATTPERAAIAKWIQAGSALEGVDDEIKKKVMGQLKKSLKKFEKDLGEKRIASILKSVEQSLAGKMQHFQFKLDGVDAAGLHHKMAEKLSGLDHKIVPHMIQLHGAKDRKMIGVMLEVEDGGPVKIQKVVKGGAAEKAGFKAGDVIIKVDGVKVTNVESLTGKIQKSKGDVKVEVKRAGKPMTLKVEPKKVTAHGIMPRVELKDFTGPIIQLKGDKKMIELHQDLIKKVAPGAKIVDGKPHGIILVNPDGSKKELSLKIDRAAENKKLLQNRAALRDQVKKRVEIHSDLGDTIKQLQKQMKELQAEIKKLKNSKN